MSSCLLVSLANDVHAATAGAGQFVLGQIMDDFNTRQICRQRFTLAATLGRRNEFFISIISGSLRSTAAVELFAGNATVNRGTILW